MDTILTGIIIALGLIVSMAGLIGCIVPMIPGPPLSYGALILLSFAKNWQPFGAAFLFAMGVLTAAVVVLDYVIPSIGAKKYGASKAGTWGSFAGLVVGFFLFPPFGMFIGGFAGAVIGELFAGRAGDKALRAGWGVLLGNLASISMKLSVSAFMLFIYVKEMFR